MATDRFRLEAEVHASLHLHRALRACALLGLLAAPLAATENPFGEAGVTEARVAEAKVALRAPDAPADAPPAAICSARIAEGASELALLCRHELGTQGEVSLLRAGEPLWTAPLASPFEATARLSEPALAALLAGELVLRIDTAAAGGLVVEATLETPIFDSGFEIFSMCEWDNYPCPSDGNVCTYDYCNSVGTCTYVNHSVPCTRPNATAQCNNGICQITSCNFGYSNCDINAANGCEVRHNTGINPCAVDINMTDNYAGDTVCGVICGSNFTNAHTFATRKGRGEAIYSALAEEKSSCLGSVEHRLDLIVPPGVDYDLYVYRDCQLVAWSTQDTGLQEVLTITEDETAQESDTFFYQVEVRYFSGASCQEWELQFTGYTC